MTGVLNAMVGHISGLRYTVTTADLGVPFGFESGAGGSMSSTSFKGQTFTEVYSQDFMPTVRTALRIKLAASSLSQSLFSQVTVQCDDGTWRVLRTADASFDNASGTVWMWGTGASPASFAAWGTAAVMRAFYIL